MNNFSPEVAKILASCLTLLASSNCSVVDNFSGRSVDYNLQADLSKNQSLLLNVIRASYREPLQFTDITTVTGQASASISGALSWPIAHDPANIARTTVFTPSASLSGGPNFTVAALNTKEFYSGVLSPIPMQTITLYLQKGVPRSVFLSLIIAQIDLGPKSCPVPFYNNMSGDNYKKFADLLQYLVYHRFDAEQIEDTTVLGPPLLEKDLKDPKKSQELEAQGVSLVRYKVNDENPYLLQEQIDRVKNSKENYYYQAEKKKASYRFCFDPPEDKFEYRVKVEDVPDYLRRSGSCSEPDAGGYISVSLDMKPLLCGASELQRNGASSSLLSSPELQRDKSSVVYLDNDVKQALSNNEVRQTIGNGKNTFLVHNRSVDDVIYYLGEIARREHSLDGQVALVPSIKIGASISDLFKVTQTSSLQQLSINKQEISTVYNGIRYSVSIDPVGNDRSAQVFSFVTELLALNNSAKDLPAPSVIPITIR